ncbi:hypothetical protein Ddye_024207 [Dipteronia dyeriana]|uniref:PGG domain-containing protein n=1 Tax=Dipteronia dyeriana TaxID=168575 RepID=A0AAD9TUF2_9ROSI|nr:hypothetical protein Ddye_024207 [Dipteronia dyeriana]
MEIRRIYEAAVEGSVISLLNLLQEDALVLDRFVVGCYSETPLHIASMLGHLDFVQEILNRKPELAGELDFRQSSPLHLATAKGYLEIVKKLVSINPEMCFARDIDGRSPLHIAVVKGHVNILRELVRVRPHAARVLMDQGETILHGCVRYNRLEAMEFLVAAIGDHEFLNSKDDDGNTILHMAVLYKQVEVIKFLITSTTIEVNALNACGFTSLDISMLKKRDFKDWEIRELLRHTIAMNSKDIRLTTTFDLGTTEIARTLKSQENPQINVLLQPDQDTYTGSGIILRKRHNLEWSEKMRSALMVVASLIATMAFQAGVNPPGGLWQDTSHGGGGVATSSTSSKPHTAGYSIFADHHPSSYSVFLACNTIGFVASLSIIVMLISGLQIRRGVYMWILMVVMWVAILSMGLTYHVSIISLASSSKCYNLAMNVQFLWFSLFAVFVVSHLMSLTAKIKNFFENL